MLLTVAADMGQAAGWSRVGSACICYSLESALQPVAALLGEGLVGSFFVGRIRSLGALPWAFICLGVDSGQLFGSRIN